MRTIHLAAIAISLSLLGCGATPTRRSPGEAFDDAGITARVKTRIARDAGVGEAAGPGRDGRTAIVGHRAGAESVAQPHRLRRPAARSPRKRRP